MSYYNYVSNDMKVTFFPDLSICPICGEGYDEDLPDPNAKRCPTCGSGWEQDQRKTTFVLNCGHGVFHSTGMPPNGHGITIYPWCSWLAEESNWCREKFDPNLNLSSLRIKLKELRRALYLMEKAGRKALFDGMWRYAFRDTYGVCMYNREKDELEFTFVNIKEDLDSAKRVMFLEKDCIILMHLELHKILYDGWEEDLTKKELEEVNGEPYNGNAQLWAEDTIESPEYFLKDGLDNDPILKRRAKVPYRKEFINPQEDQYSVNDYRTAIYKFKGQVGEIRERIKKLSGGI